MTKKQLAFYIFCSLVMAVFFAILKTETVLAAFVVVALAVSFIVKNNILK